VVICLERGADLHTAQLMSLPLTVSCFSKIQIGFTFLVPAHLGSPGKGPLNGCVYLPKIIRIQQHSCGLELKTLRIPFKDIVLAQLAGLLFCSYIMMGQTNQRKQDPNTVS